VNDDLTDLPAFGAVKTEGGTDACYDLPPDPDGAKEMSSVRRRASSTSIEAVKIPATTGRDDVLANDLIVLVSTLEQKRAQLVQLQSGSDPAAVLDIARKMVRAVTKLIDQHLTLQTSGAALTVALAEGKDLCDSMEALKAEYDDSGFNGMMRFFRRSSLSRSERRRLFRLLVGRLHEAVERFFVLCREHFEAPAAAVEWNQTYTLFLAELDQVVSVLQ
jgi:hypothetical protein